ncbi:MAG: hypothetical protein M1818_008535 [Claussenomyces sp. TS43310]|nr:MAG: hypothetical protein M1818_008535 [Claussenomyces sp. TS43310]
MAPPADAAKALQGNRPRPTARAIVPAIPLPYIQKRKKQVVTTPRVDEVIAASPVVETVAASSTTFHPPTNASPDATAATSGTVATPTPDKPATLSVEADVKESNTEDQQSPAETLQVQESQLVHPVASSDSHSSGSRSTHNMAAPFVLANANQSNLPSTDHVRFPRQAQFTGQAPPMHHTHPSASSLVFGGYPESTNSSPAPPMSANGSQQHQYQPYHDGGRVQAPKYPNGGHMHNISNGFSLMGPPGSSGPYQRPDAFVNHNGGPENYARRQMVSFGPGEGVPPTGVQYAESQRFPQFDPATSQSFHGSQSSAPTEQEVGGPAFYTQHAVAGNGINGHTEDIRLYHQPQPKVRTGSQPVAVGQGHYAPQSISQPPMPNVDNLDGLLGYLQAQFAEPQFADYILELRYSDDRATPVRIPGHNLLFARSPALKKLMTAQAQESTTDGLTSRTILIQSDDRFLRSDAFWMAVQRLYGSPLLVPGATTSVVHSASQPPSTLPGTLADRFDFALGYAAAGHLLQMPPVVNRGIDIASHFVNAQTVEKAFDFALDGGLDSQWTLEPNQNSFSPSTYGPDVNMLLHSALNFTITSFPPNFEFEKSVSNPALHARLPTVPDVRPTPSKHRLSNIKFGDHSFEEEEVTPPLANNSPLNITLSRILLNLPFQLLKYVLESSRLGNVSGWATASLRQKVMHSVVEEREKRRNHVFGNTSVSNAEREANVKGWEAVGWRESVGLMGAETSVLGREWIGFVLRDGN